MRALHHMRIKHGILDDDLAAQAEPEGQGEASPTPWPADQPAVSARADVAAPASGGGSGRRLPERSRVQPVGGAAAPDWQPAGMRRQQRRQRQLM